jgi:hypothetical protein
MSRLAWTWRDLRIVVNAVWPNLAAFIAMLLLAAILLQASGTNPSISFNRLLTDVFYMAFLEPRAEELGDALLPTLLMFVLPALTLVIIGEGALRVFTVYLRRGAHKEEWNLLVAKTFSKHIIICGVGELGRAVVLRLIHSNPNAQVILVDTRPNILAELGLSGPNLCEVHADMTAQASLEAANCRDASLIILASGNDAYNLEAGFKALRLNPNAQIWIRLYRSGLASLIGTRENVHFFSPYERAAEALMEQIAQPTRQEHGARS